jgi:hypothetical protein
MSCVVGHSSSRRRRVLMRVVVVVVATGRRVDDLEIRHFIKKKAKLTLSLQRNRRGNKQSSSVNK